MSAQTLSTSTMVFNVPATSTCISDTNHGYVVWRVRFSNGEVKTFKFPVRDGYMVVLKDVVP